MTKKQKKTPLLSRLAILIVFAVGAYLVYTYAWDRSAPLIHSEESPPAPEFIYDDKPVIETISRWQKENLDRDHINRKLPEKFEVLVLDEDINANDTPNYVVISADNQLPGLDNFLSEAGFTHVFRDLVVYEQRGKTLRPLLTINSESIRNENGEQLIDQVTARYGYALLLESYEHETLYDKPVKLIEIVMIDRDGREASDEIVIYWDPSESAFKATNTFGAP